ncbi:hypothetical protein LXL04_026024 [Taraxacum kok-saghyz]
MEENAGSWSKNATIISSGTEGEKDEDDGVTNQPNRKVEDCGWVVVRERCSGHHTLHFLFVIFKIVEPNSPVSSLLEVSRSRNPDMSLQSNLRFSQSSRDEIRKLCTATSEELISLSGLVRSPKLPALMLSNQATTNSEVDCEEAALKAEIGSGGRSSNAGGVDGDGAGRRSWLTAGGRDINDMESNVFAPAARKGVCTQIVDRQYLPQIAMTYLLGTLLVSKIQQVASRGTLSYAF